MWCYNNDCISHTHTHTHTPTPTRTHILQHTLPLISAVCIWTYTPRTPLNTYRLQITKPRWLTTPTHTPTHTHFTAHSASDFCCWYLDLYSKNATKYIFINGHIGFRKQNLDDSTRTSPRPHTHTRTSPPPRPHTHALVFYSTLCLWSLLFVFDLNSKNAIMGPHLRTLSLEPEWVSA